MDANKTNKPEPQKDGQKLKPCCVCLDTKRVRDECIIQNGEDECKKFIEAHKKCMRDLGFDI